MTTYAEIISNAILDALGPNYDPDAWQPPAASSATAGSYTERANSDANVSARA